MVDPMYVIDLDLGNLASIENIFKKLSIPVCLCRHPSDLVHATRIILPGVGHFDAMMGALKSRDFEPVLRAHAEKKTWLLGICLGMQAMTQGSEEGHLPGLGLIEGWTRKFPIQQGLKIPHMGWSRVTPAQKHPLLEGLGEDARFYSVHSYYVALESDRDTLLRSHYGLSFASAFAKDSIVGIQCHPEKSLEAGFRLLKNFSEYTAQAFTDSFSASILPLPCQPPPERTPKRLMPSLLIAERALVKTRAFKKPVHIGDPINAVRIFNQKAVDELIVLDILAYQKGMDWDFLKRITREAFMPLVYGGGVQSIEQARDLFRIGFEKIALGTLAYQHPSLLEQASKCFGSQALIGVVDLKKDFWGRTRPTFERARRWIKKNPLDYAQALEHLGVGEILLMDVDREGSFSGMNLSTIRSLSAAVNIPLIATGGCGTLEHIREAWDAGADAVALGSMAVFQGKDLGVLIKFPSQEEQALIRSLSHAQTP